MRACLGVYLGMHVEYKYYIHFMLYKFVYEFSEIKYNYKPNVVKLLSKGIATDSSKQKSLHGVIPVYYHMPHHIG